MLFDYLIVGEEQKFGISKMINYTINVLISHKVEIDSQISVQFGNLNFFIIRLWNFQAFRKVERIDPYAHTLDC